MRDVFSNQDLFKFSISLMPVPPNWLKYMIGFFFLISSVDVNCEIKCKDAYLLEFSTQVYSRNKNCSEITT